MWMFRWAHKITYFLHVCAVCLSAVSDGKSHDSLTIVPWARGRSLVSRHASVKPPELNCFVSWRSGERGWRKEEVQVQQSTFTVRLHTDRSGDSWCCRRVANGLPPGAGSPHRQYNCWAAFLPVSHAAGASQRLRAPWHCRLRHWHCCHRHLDNEVALLW